MEHHMSEYIEYLNHRSNWAIYTIAMLNNQRVSKRTKMLFMMYVWFVKFDHISNISSDLYVFKKKKMSENPWN